MGVTTELNAGFRLLATSDVSQWWTDKTSEEKKTYIEEHPNSKYAKDKIEQDKDTTDNKDNKDTKSPERSESPKTQAKSPSHVANVLRKTFPKLSKATTALTHLAKGKELDEEHKEVLHDFGALAVKTALGHVVGETGAHFLGSLSYNATHYAISHFKRHRDDKKNAKKDDVEVFAAAIDEGIKDAKVIGKSISNFFKKSAHHITQVVEHSFKEVKPALNGLNSIRKGEKPTDEQKKAIKGLGKIVLSTAIAAMPGGIAVHVTTGIGATAVAYAVQKIRSSPVEGSLIHHFIESVGESLEDAIIASGSEK